ncbi:hydroxyacylglutathione hydrolase [Pleionea mediterranea]|uniref:Hydroxyacylglutathione hydrolase n=1 Tax=Pleionea mediterranea TaxID=523701 RepID=A0A316G0V6_9GAMM|nr:hydroxyacylglutathione hydrolase [Pleionea mediterranea]PWK54551.1 hydroxyacylglutathione hydrolase [Pleionea mediterranea]
MQVDRIAAFSDNYIWALRNDRASCCTLVDPGESEPVEHYLAQNNLSLASILITHHHYDHTGGVEKLKQQHQCKVYGPDNAKIKGIDQTLKQGDSITLSEIDASFDIIEVPGHTLDHIAYILKDRIGENRIDKKSVFCGDTLFAGGCGRLFEGTPEQMWHSLQKLASLPANTTVYCAHEYTEANLAFAREVDKHNADLKRRQELVKQKRADNQATVPSTIEEELATNPFLRANRKEVASAAETFSGQPLSTPEDVFAVIRQWKDNF